MKGQYMWFLPLSCVNSIIVNIQEPDLSDCCVLAAPPGASVTAKYTRHVLWTGRRCQRRLGRCARSGAERGEGR